MLTTLLTSLPLIVVIACASAAMLYACVYLVLFAENRRYWQARFRQMAPTSDEYPRCLLVVPCKGLEHGLRDNLAGLLRQDYPNYEVTFVVEDGRDPAIPIIREVIREHRFVTARLLIAGRADVSGQKVHNLQAATSDLKPEIEILVFADSDAGTKNTWLRWMTGGIGRERLGARTGYRWMTPLDKRVPTLIGCSINNAVASMFGNGGHFLVWGGAWAIHRRVFDAASLRET
ncbi:MAG: glycosyltransferase family 2 protein, partial [Planctomycetota bacterium]